MKIIDRYVIGKFLQLFFLCYISLEAVYVVFDLINNLGTFLDAGNAARLLATVPEYYFINSFVFVDMIFPILILLAATTATSMMARQNEVIALLATGVSPGRIVAPIVVGAIAISFSFAGVREAFLPSRLVELTMAPGDFVRRSDEVDAFRSYDYSTKISIDGEKVVRSEGKLTEPRVVFSRNLNKYGNRVVAREAFYRPAEGDRPAGWLLCGVSSPKALLQGKSLVDEATGKTVVYSPKDAAGLKPDEVFVATNLDLKRIASGDYWRQYDSTREMKKALADPTFGDAAVELGIRAHTRIFRPLTDLIPLFLGLPFVFMRSDRNVFAAIGVGVLLAGAYVASQYAFAYLGQKTGSIFWGVWGPVLMFAPVAAVAFGELLKKEV